MTDTTVQIIDETPYHDQQRIYKRGDRVNYKGDENGDGAVTGTYVWATMAHEILRYVIEHPQGHPKSAFIQDYLQGRFPDGFEAVHSSMLNDDLLYIYADPEELEPFHEPLKDDNARK